MRCSFHWKKEIEDNCSAGGAGGLRPPAGARGVLASFPFPRSFHWEKEVEGNCSAGGAGGLRPPAGARGVLASFPFPRLPPQAAQVRYRRSYHLCLL